MSTAGWIFLVGMRVLDLGGMVVWLIWYFRRRDEPGDDWRDWDDWDDPSPDSGPSSPQGPGVKAPLTDAEPWPARLRDHAAPRPQRTDRRSLPAPRREREPSRQRETTEQGRSERGALVRRRPGALGRARRTQRAAPARPPEGR